MLPSYNGEKTIRGTVVSVLNQTLTDLELLVVDDGSTDSTIEQLDLNDERLEVFTFPNAGLAANRNRGIARSSGEYIAFIDQDDLWHPEKLQAQLLALQSNPRASVAFSWVDCIDEEGNFLRPNTRKEAQGDIYSIQLQENLMVCGSNALIRRKALDKVGGFDETLASAEDLDLWIRLSARFRFVCVPQVHVYYRISTTTLSFNVVKAETAAKRVIERSFQEAPSHLQRLKRNSFGNFYRFLSVQALTGLPNRSTALKAIAYLSRAVYYSPWLLKKTALYQAILAALFMLLLPPGSSRALFSRFKPLFDASNLHKYWQVEFIPRLVATDNLGQASNPVAILDLEVQDIPSYIQVPDRFHHAMALIRMDGRPVGQAVFEAPRFPIDGIELLDLLIDVAGKPFWKKWLNDWLHWKPAIDVNPQTKVTIAVCTRDRPEKLKSCLDGIMELPDDGQEILVVDNHPSTDETRQLVADYPGIRYLLEDKTGVSSARNRALLEAEGEIVVFTDDDAIPHKGWLRGIVPNFSDPEVLCVTGLTMPLELETKAQLWFELFHGFGHGYERKEFNKDNLYPVSVGSVGSGVNMAVRKDIVQRVGGFDEQFGPGTPIPAGEDQELLARIISQGYKIVYEPSALVWHRHRPTLEELNRTLFQYGIGLSCFLAHRLLRYNDLFAFQSAWWMVRHHYLAALLFPFSKRVGSIPPRLIRKEMLGCLIGLWIYKSSYKAR